jgi:hypothetical protein
MATRRAVVPVVGLAGSLALLLYCYRPVLFGSEQFAYRDAMHFYDPLHRFVQQEWDAGRWPIWDPGRNGGTPLLGNPVTAVFYPGKLVYAVLPHAWATRFYVIGHTVLALAGVVALLRTWGTSWAGATLAGMSYAFGAPVLFQYCNVIFLVGAAWAPWGFLALDGLLRRQRLLALIALAVVLALQFLGGDPEGAYLTAFCGFGYAVVLQLHRSRTTGNAPQRTEWRRPWLALALVALWIVLMAGADVLISRWPPASSLPPRWCISVLLWGAIAVALRRARLGRPLATLAGACVLAGALAAVQLLPGVEFARLSWRLNETRSLNEFHFSLEPWRLPEALWPNVFGVEAPEFRSWLQAVRPAGSEAPWVSSVYVGGLTVMLAVAALGSRTDAPWRAWLAAVAAVSLAASCGQFLGPLWWLRAVPGLASVLGPHDPVSFSSRSDGFAGDGLGSPYGLLTALLPGFRLFRYPAKLLTFSALAVSALAGLGWDVLASGPSRWASRWRRWVLIAGAVILGLLIVADGALTHVVSEMLPPHPAYGPVDAPMALWETRRGLVQGSVVLGCGAILATLARRRVALAGTAALVVMALDLGAANARLIWTAPQADFEAEPRAARLIADAERATPSAGPFRFFRLPLWIPNRFSRYRSPHRFHELTVWERDTLQSINALPLGLGETLAHGTLELEDYLSFFDPEIVRARGATARALGLADATRVLYYPRRGLDLWNTRYFVTPILPDGWTALGRGYAALLTDSQAVFPDRRRLSERGPDSWTQTQDWQLLRNDAAFPRAWVVHFAEVGAPRDRILFDILYPDDEFMSLPNRPARDLHDVAYIETEDPARLSGFIPRSRVEASGSVAITRYEPQRVELAASLTSPGFVILADTFYPGWRLAIDGHPTPILRANRLMRGAAVPAGTHRLTYTYEPLSFRLGLSVSVASVVFVGVVLIWLTAASRSRLTRYPAPHPPG